MQCCYSFQVSLTARFFQTMQDFFFPKTEGEGPETGPLEPDHSHLFGVQRETFSFMYTCTCVYVRIYIVHVYYKCVYICRV